MPRLEEFKQKKLYYFYSEKTGRKLRKFSGDRISEHEISEFEIPSFLLEIPIREKKENASQKTLYSKA